MSSSFCSKILLFGEYGIIKGSKGMAIPFEAFKGQLQFRTQMQLDQQLVTLFEFIKRSQILKKEMYLDKMHKDLQQGLYFASTIPQGQGLGSSGALCAALFDRYAKYYSREKEYEAEELAYIQELLAIIESFYHGTSSGLDPLISFFNRPIIIHPEHRLEFIARPQLKKFGEFYLLETQVERKTSPLVHQFLKDCSDEDYMQGVRKFVDLNEKLIMNTLEENTIEFSHHFSEISKLQYVYFEKMIPQNLKEIWLTGLESKDYSMKLCGAGGGGFFMLYSPSGKVPLHNNLLPFS